MADPRILSPIPTPPAQRWREVRLLYLPRTVFALGILVSAWLWSHSVAPATLVAEADVEQREVRSARSGVISGLAVGLLEPVSAGQVVGYVKPSQGIPSSDVKMPESAVKLAESPGAMPLVAPIEGVVSEILRHPGEVVAAGDSVLRITSRRTERLTGFLRQPLPFEPKPGMIAEVRTRGGARQIAVTTITGVGMAMESIPVGLVAAMRLPDKPAPERALRIHFAMPRGLNLRPGENVDIIVH